jgi:NCAIR mutase (PurE)-related protein
MTPVTSEGERDLQRKVLYVGQAEIMTNMGPVPINFEIEAATFAQAVAGFGAAAAAGIERTVQQIQEMRRQQASQLVVPGGMGGMGGPGGMPGAPRGKFQIP